MGHRVAAWVPRWWAGEGGPVGALLDAVLWPAELLYRGAAMLRNRAFDRGWIGVERAPIPVVSVGNLGVGGAGKTPFAAWLAAQLEGWGARPAVVLRGYGRDEVLVHERLNPTVPVFAFARRIDGVRAAAAAGCRIAVLDDGFQHRRLHRDLDVLLVAVEAWRARRALLPRGPWREPPAAARRADAVVLTRKSAGHEDAAALRRELEPVVTRAILAECRLAPAGLEGLHDSEPYSLAELRGSQVLAVAALAAPASFAANLQTAGADVELAAFPDHHEFTTAEAAALVERAAGRPLLMTLKDAVKLRPLLDAGVRALVLHQRLEFTAGEAELLRALRRAAGMGE